MTYTFKRSAALLGLVASSSLVLAACSETGNSSSEGAESPDNLSGASGQLVAEGASSQQKAMDLFGIKFNESTGNNLSYTATGSGSGQKQFIAGQVAFGGSDSPLDEEQVAAAAKRCEGNDAWHLPMVIGPVAVAYNLDGVDGLNLSVENVAKIFKGEITKWNDEAIAAENEGVDLPDSEIEVVYRSEESGTSDNFQKFLKAAVPDLWDTTGKSFPSTTGAGANGSTGVVGQVSATPGAITYVEAGFATEAGLGVANIDFGHGPVELNNETVGKALDNLEYAGEGHDMVVDANKLFSMDVEGAYPVVLTTYEIVCSAGYDENTAGLVKDFLKVVLANQDQDLEAQGYIPVSGEFKKKLEDAVDALQ
ncbi:MULTISPECIES: phosphate ABC transporter substrate-binding protein PstS [Corynebacterium]|uniref:phosphate ABC transporter substrate-binding protein PstS n=1 Tax=Corynebacterium TaxID=1716 RepID=UPI00124DEB34|nr:MULTISPECIES: phosphate ABC transporter substrate-binding protein PstS [Corynebacterium]